MKKPPDDGQEGRGLRIDPKELMKTVVNDYILYEYGTEVNPIKIIAWLATKEANQIAWLIGRAALPVADGEGEKVPGIKDVPWFPPGENIHDLLEQDHILPSAVTGGVKDDLLQTAITELESLIAQGQRNETEKNINDGLRMAIGVLRLQMTWIKNHPSEGQPAQENILAAATQKRDLLFDVLSSYERRIEIRAAALAFIKAFDELLEVAP